MTEADAKQLDEILQRLYPSPDGEMSRIRVTYHIVGRMLQIMHDAGAGGPEAIRTVVSSALDYLCRSMPVADAGMTLRQMADVLESTNQRQTPATAKH